MPTVAERIAEFPKYIRSYEDPKYRMKVERMADAVADMVQLPFRGSYLDIGCGQGDMLNRAAEMGFSPVMGTEIVPKLIDGERVVYGEAHNLPFPDKSFDVVSAYDVIEHLQRGDDEALCKEMMRVARCHILLTANNKSSKNRHTGEERHINRRPYAEWHDLFVQWFEGATVIKLRAKQYISEPWRIDL